MPVELKSKDLEERTFKFAQRVRLFIKELPHSISNNEDVKQLVRSSGSVAANYIEANEALSKKDFTMKIKICLKEAKESCLWLRLLNCSELETGKEREALMQEAKELMLIFSAIAAKCR